MVARYTTCRTCENSVGVVSSGGAPTPAGTSVFTKHNWDMGIGYLCLNGWGINHLMGGAFISFLCVMISFHCHTQEVVCGVPTRFSETPAVSLATECTLIIFTLVSSILKC